MLFHGEEDGRQMLETWGFWRLLGKHSEKGARLLSYELLVWVNGKEKDHTMIRSLESEKTPLVLFHVINTLVLHVCWNKTHKHVADSTDIFSVRHAILPVRTRKANLQNVPLVGAF